jgi:hypothetical protein
MTDFLDRLVRRFTESLAWYVPRTGLVARLGTFVAGVRPLQHLPWDRRVREQSRLEHAVGSGATLTFALASPAGAAVSPATLTADADPICNEPQYCWIDGYPCACCGGADDSCPPNTQAGSYWSYCCSNTMIFFRDCCVSQTSIQCPADCPFCQNSSQPSWCGLGEFTQYVCTLAQSVGSC